jgi:hypothetical protein
VEALLFASTEDHTLKFFENRMLNNVFEPEGKSSFGRSGGLWKNNIKTILRGKG